EREREKLQNEIAELTAILESESRLREVVSGELASVAERFADPRRTVLLEGSGAPRTAAVPLEVADDPCLVLLSSTGLVARTPIATAERDPGDLFSAAAPAGRGGPAAAPRSAHDVMVSSVAATARGSIAVVTSAGRLIRVGALEIPALPPSAHSPSLAGGAPVTEFLALQPGETVVGLAAPDAAGARRGPGPGRGGGQGGARPPPGRAGAGRRGPA